MQEFTVEAAQVFLPDEIVETNVTVSDGKIAEIGGPARGTLVDGRGLCLAPALIDVHGDAFERQIMPRPGVYVPFAVGILESDRQLAANGIATTYHALTLSWEPGLRSVERGAEFLQTLRRLAPRLTVENRVQLRWETFAFEAVQLIEASLGAPLTPSLAFNDHTSMTMRPFDMPVQERAFEFGADFLPANMDDPRFTERHRSHAQRAGIDIEEYLRRFRDVWERRPDVPAQMADLAQKARAQGVPMLSHDDTQLETRAYFRELGADVAEFPMTRPTAENARSEGDKIIFGAPNVVRGGSHIGSLSAANMVEDGLCDALASDYFYPAMLAAVARLDAERRAPRCALWKLVSDGPARAMKLHDRGTIAPGKRADLVLVDWPKTGTPAIRATWVAGRQAYAAQPHAA